MTLINKILSDSLYSTFRIGVDIVRALIVIPLITNLLGASSFGIWTTVLAFATLVSSAGGVHLHGSLIRSTSQSNSKAQSYSDILTMSIIISAIIALILIGIGSVVDISKLFDTDGDSQAILIAATILVVGNILYKININYPRSLGKIRVYELLTIATKLIEICVLAAVFLSNRGILHGIFGLAGIQFSISFIIFAYILSRYSVPWPDISNFWGYAKYGLPMIPKELSTSLLQNADKYLLLVFLSPAAVGIYAVAYTVARFLMNISKVLNPTLYPTITAAWDNNRHDEISNTYYQIFRIYSLFAIPAFFGIAFLGKPLSQILSTPEIASQGWILIPILGFGFLIRGYDNFLSYILNSTKKTNKIMISVVSSSILNIILNVILILRYGIIGAAIATTISQINAAYLIYRYSSKEININIPSKSIFNSILSSTIMIIVLQMVTVNLTLFSRLVIAPILGVIIYGVLVRILGEVRYTEIWQYVDGI